MNLNILEKAIIATVVYYDVLDYPLTGFEIFKYLINPVHITALSGIGPSGEIEPIGNITLLGVLKTIKSQSLEKYISEKNGFYFLKGREKIIQTRIERQKISDEMWKKARKIIKWLQFLPYVRMVAMSGSLAMDNAKKESDVDLLIAVKNKRIWTARFLITLFLQIIGQRRHGKKIQNRFCLNHYITDKSLKINLFSLYTAHLYAHLVPILETERNIYSRFQKENNWISNYLLFYNYQELGNQRKIKTNSFLTGIAKIKEFILNSFLGTILEKLLGFFQKKHIKNHPLRNQKGGRVMADDNQLEFHPDSPEAKIIDKYNQSMLILGFQVKEGDSGLIINV